MQRIYHLYVWSSLLLVVLIASCSGSKPERIQIQIYNDDRLMFSAFHRANANQPETELWKELHKKIQFTAIDGNPSIPESNNLFNRKPYIDPSGNITILILHKDKVLAKTVLDKIHFKPNEDHKTWILDFGEADRILKSINHKSKIDDVLPDNKIQVPDELSEPEPTMKTIAEPSTEITEE